LTMELDTLRHSTSHVMAQAVKRLFPGVKLAIGPAIEDGFYYDFDPPQPFSEEDLPEIEAEMARIIKENQKFERSELGKDEALKLFEKMGEPYKVELIKDIPDEKVSLYKNGDFVDLCRGPHISSTGQIKAFKLLSATGAYWRGSEKNKMLQRIYGTAFATKEELETYLKAKEEAEKRDHNKIGRMLEIFTTHEAVGQGLPLIMPKGAKIIQILQRFVEDEEEKRGYLLTKTPYMAKSDLYKISGHWDHYREGMFIINSKDEEVLALRPMTCPFQFMIYKSKTRSYKDRPRKDSETAVLFRNESSGEMHGLTRVRQFTLADAHIICLPEQLEEEFKKVLDLIKFVMKTLGIENEIWYRFSKWDPSNKEKYIDDPKAWEESQKIMKKILDDIKLDYKEVDGEAAFYGPKLDIQFKNVYGKEDTIFTVQVDFALPGRFGMDYVDKDGSLKTPMVIHRSSIGCYERTLALLIEHYAGAFPVWLSPVQTVIIPISDEHMAYAEKVAQILRDRDIRVEINDKSGRMQHKIRDAEVQKVPYMLIVGAKEAQAESVSVRERSKGDLGPMKLADFADKIVTEVKEKK